MSWSTTFLEGLAARLAADAPAAFAFPSPGPGLAVVHIGALPTAPDLAASLFLYPVDGDSGHTTITVGVQVRLRGRPNVRRDVVELADALYEVLDDRTGYHVGDIPVIRSWEQSGTDLPPDGNGRAQATRNYYFHTTRQTANRTD